MKQNTIQVSLQIVAVVAQLIGAVHLSKMLVTIGYSGGIQGIGHGSLNVMGLLSAAMPLLWGITLFVASPNIARHIAKGLPE